MAFTFQGFLNKAHLIFFIVGRSSEPSSRRTWLRRTLSAAS